ncbi:MAG: SDR family oxidoreductase [Candidatus Heimdallarchaeota archaeon]|nr:SDR family oxidoreductase [Candidatus Heimdallarchaeota archaeon]
MKVALITGATSGIGKATAYKFAEQGYSLMLTGRNDDELKILEDELDVIVNTIAVDLRIEGAAKVVIDETIKSYNQLDVLVNAAGIIASGTVENTSMEQWSDMFKLNVDAIFQLIQLSIPYLEKSGIKSIVNVSSVVGLRQFPGVFSYSVSKAAVDQLTKVVALELAPKQIRCNGINPGVIISNLHKRGGMDEEKYANFLEHSKNTHPLGRVGRVDEAAELIYFLASEKSGWITGQTIAIDGGRSLTCFR